MEFCSGRRLVLVKFIREAFNKEKNKKCGFFPHLPDTPPLPKCGNFAVKKGRKRAKMRKKRQKTPFFPLLQCGKNQKSQSQLKKTLILNPPLTFSVSEYQILV